MSWRRSLVALGVLILAGCPGRDQAKALEDRVARLETRVAAIEKDAASAPTPAPALSPRAVPPPAATLPSVSIRDEVAAADYSNAATIIREHCTKEYPTDFNMQAYCEKQQREGIEKLMAGAPPGIPADAFKIIRSKCASEYPTDFTMRAYCENQQYEGYRSVSGR